MTIAALLAPENLESLDARAIETYNLKAAAKFCLHPELGPSAYEGDIDRARVVLLLANPGYDSTSTIDDHRFSKTGWPLAGLHPAAPDGLRIWWHARLRGLVDRFGAKHVASTVACLQVTPWASPNFDADLRLPSRSAILAAAGQCAMRGSVMILMRAQRLWFESPELASSSKRFRVNSWLTSYVSPGNLSAAAWEAVVTAVADA